MAQYRLVFLKRAEKNLDDLDPHIAGHIVSALESKLATHPNIFGKPLRYSLRNKQTLRIGDWRVVYETEGAMVIIFSIFHRSKGY